MQSGSYLDEAPAESPSRVDVCASICRYKIGCACVSRGRACGFAGNTASMRENSLLLRIFLGREELGEGRERRVGETSMNALKIS